MKKIFSVLVLSFSVLSTSACGTAEKTSATGTPGKSETVKTYTIGTSVLYPPFEYEKDGKYIGIDMDLIRAIAEVEGFKVDIKSMAFKGIIPAVQANQLDGAIGAISITEERKKVIDFSDPYYEAGLTLVTRDDNTEIKGPQDLKGKKIAVKQGSTEANMATELAKKYGANLVFFDDSPSIFQEIINKNADVTIIDFPVIAYKIAIEPNSKLKIVGDKLNGDLIGIVVSKERPDLLQKINDGLKKLKENGKYDAIVKSYIGSTKLQ